MPDEIKVARIIVVNQVWPVRGASYNQHTTEKQYR